MKSFIPVLLCLSFLTAPGFADDELLSPKLIVVREYLLGIEPEWKPQIIKSHSTGHPQEVQYFGEDESNEFVLSKTISYYDNGVKKEECDYGMSGKEKGLVHGLSVRWHENGIEDEISYFKEGKLHGPRMTFYVDGVLKSKEVFEDGLQAGVKVDYFQDNTKKGEWHYSHGVLNGEKWEYFLDGKRKSLTSYRDGKEEGYAYQWHENDVVAVKTFYENGLVTNDGKKPAFTRYDQFHAMTEVAEAVDGVATGTLIFYYPTGQEKMKGGNKDGSRHGTFTYYFENGGVQGEEFYHEGVSCRKHWMKHENGKEFWHAEFDDKGTSLAPIKIYTDTGVLIREFSKKEGNEHGKLREWYPSGVLKFDGVCNSGELEGEVLQYFDNGMPWVFSHYQDGKLHGKIQKWHKNGKVAFKAKYSEGSINGEAIEWHENGEMARKEYHVFGVPHGHLQAFTAQGILTQSTNYDHGELVGSTKEYDEKGNLVFDATYSAGKFHGNVTSYYKNEQPNYVYEYRFGLKDGKGIEFWENGKLKFQAHYHEDKLEGIAQAWFDNGARHFTRFYTDGMPVGEQKFYFHCQNPDEENEALNKVFNYDSAGRLHQEQRIYYADGKISSLLTYENGDLHGLKSLWSDRGEIIQECWYEKSKLEGKFFMRDPSGHEIVCYYEKNKKHGPFERYYPDQARFGKVKALEATYIRGFLEGEVVEFNEAGLKTSSCNFEHGKKEGSAYTFDTRGLLVSKILFSNDMKEGDVTQYFPNGRVFKVTPHVNNEIEGEQITYFIDGSVSSSSFYQKGKLHGLSKSWNENGKVIFEGQYNLGKKDGKFNKYYDNGQPRLLQEFNEDMISSKKAFDPEGKELLQSGSLPR